MSNHWDLLCRTCGDACGLSWNRGGDYIQQLIPHLSVIADCAEKLAPVREILDHHSTWEIVLPWELVAFAKQHHSHVLTAVDEYGVFHGECIHDYECPCCRIRVRCRRPRDHDGEDGPAEQAGPTG